MMLRVVITGTEAQVAERVNICHAQGFLPLPCPILQIKSRPMELLQAFIQAERPFDAWVFTSTNGVQVCESLLKALPYQPAMYAVGTKTAVALQKYGIPVAGVPSMAQAAEIATLFPERPFGRVLLLRGGLSDATLPQKLRVKGWEVADIPVYETLFQPLSLHALSFFELIPDAVLFMSGSAIEGLKAALSDVTWRALQGQKVVCVGEQTARLAQQAGFNRVQFASLATFEAMVELLKGSET